MPEYIILVSAIVCAGACATLYFQRGSVPALAAAILASVVLLYGIGQYFDRGNVEARALGFADAADQRAALSAGITDSAQWKRQKEQPVQPPATVVKRPEDGATRLNSLAPAPKAEELPSQPLAAGEPAAKVTITNFSARKTAPRYVEVSGTVINRNEFAIKNVVLTCGDKSYASADVSVVLDQVIPPRGELPVAGLRLGPIRPELPPTVCAIARYERAN